jgi:hypothetical protein
MIDFVGVFFNLTRGLCGIIRPPTIVGRDDRDNPLQRRGVP